MCVCVCVCVCVCGRARARYVDPFRTFVICTPLYFGWSVTHFHYFYYFEESYLRVMCTCKYEKMCRIIACAKVLNCGVMYEG